MSTQTSNMLLRAKIAVAAACLLGLSAAMIRHYIPLKVVTRLTKSGERYFEWVSNSLVDPVLFKNICLTIWVMLNFVVPFLITMTSTTITIVRLLRQSRERRSLQQGRLAVTRDYRTTVTLVSIVVTFICLRGPHMFLAVLFVLRYIDWSKRWYTLFYITISLVMLDPISNFIIYFVAGRQFRRSLKRMLVCRGFCCRRFRDSDAICEESV